MLFQAGSFNHRLGNAWLDEPVVGYGFSTCWLTQGGAMAKAVGAAVCSQTF